MFTDPLIGRQLANFRLERIIQRGGMAQVYYGLDVKLERPVAIKIIDTFYRENPVYARRFIEEARMVATWSHENIIRIYYADDQEGLYYFVMEYIDGVDLGAMVADFHRQGTYLPHNEVIRIGRGIAAALDYAHERGVIHRDVKPSNVMIAKDGRVILMDFGLALSIQGGSIGEAFGTPQYIAPEQANRSADAVPQSDVYSLGVILYELLTGTIPFDDPSAATLVIQHLLHEPPIPSEINPNLTAQVDQVLLTALRKKPEERYETASDLIDALEKVLHELPLAAAQPFALKLPPPPAGLTPLPEILPSEPHLPAAAADDSLFPSPQERRFNWLLVGVILFGLTALLLISWEAWRGNRPEPVEIAAATSTLSLPPSLQPTRTQIAAPIISTHINTPTATSIPTLTPTPTASSTPSVTPTQTPSPIPSPTAPPPLEEGHEIQFFYDNYSFYLLNADENSIAIGLIAFEAIDDRIGQSAAYLFSGRLWSDFFDELEEGKCVRIEIVGAPAWLRPAECTGYNATVTPPNAASDRVFWLSRPNISQFRVLWFGQEVGRCQTQLGICRVFLPE